jgi:hypothetical protein
VSSRKHTSSKVYHGDKVASQVVHCIYAASTTDPGTTSHRRLPPPSRGVVVPPRRRIGPGYAGVSTLRPRALLRKKTRLGIRGGSRSASTPALKCTTRAVQKQRKTRTRGRQTSSRVKSCIATTPPPPPTSTLDASQSPGIPVPAPDVPLPFSRCPPPKIRKKEKPKKSPLTRYHPRPYSPCSRYSYSSPQYSSCPHPHRHYFRESSPY